MPRIVLAYSGGLDTSVAIPWLAEHHDAEVIAVTLDLGQGRELADVRQRALALGAVRAHVIDAREEFARDYVLPALKVGAVYEDRYPLVSALGRPLIAKYLVEIARMEGADRIAHGCTGKTTDQVRLEVSIRALDPALQVVAPARTWGMSRHEKIDYARQRDIAVAVTADHPYSVDGNLWGRSIQGGVIEDPWREPPADAYALTRPAAECPDEPASVDLEFDRGVPVKVNGVPMPLVELIGSLETIAGAHGVGRIDMVENRLLGIKSREVYEAPAAVALHLAHRELEGLVTTRDLERVKHDLARRYADLVYDGLWFTPMREAIEAFAEKVQERVTGTVRLKCFKGDCRVSGRRSPFALYDQALATYDTGDTFEHAAAAGFIQIWGLPVETAMRAGRPGAPEAAPRAGAPPR